MFKMQEMLRVLKWTNLCHLFKGCQTWYVREVEHVNLNYYKRYHIVEDWLELHIISIECMRYTKRLGCIDVNDYGGIYWRYMKTLYKGVFKWTKHVRDVKHTCDIVLHHFELNHLCKRHWCMRFTVI